jgi:hypothetical protein
MVRKKRTDELEEYQKNPVRLNNPLIQTEPPKQEETKQEETQKNNVVFDKNKIIVNGKELSRKEYEQEKERLKAIKGGGAVGTGAFAGETAEERQQNYNIFKMQGGQTTSSNIPFNAQQPQIDPNLPQSLYNYQDLNILQGFETLGLIDTPKGQKLKEAINLEGGQFKSGANIALATLGLFFDLGDNLSKVATFGALGKDTIDVKKAKDNISLAQDIIDRQISLIPTGEINISELQRAVAQYTKNLSYLESTNKRIGLDNFAYWIDDGRNLEEEIATYKSNFDELDRLLKNAKLMQAQNNLLMRQTY